MKLKLRKKKLRRLWKENKKRQRNMLGKKNKKPKMQLRRSKKRQKPMPLLKRQRHRSMQTRNSMQSIAKFKKARIIFKKKRMQPRIWLIQSTLQLKIMHRRRNKQHLASQIAKEIRHKVTLMISMPQLKIMSTKKEMPLKHLQMINMIKQRHLAMQNLSKPNNIPMESESRQKLI